MFNFKGRMIIGLLFIMLSTNATASDGLFDITVTALKGSIGSEWNSIKNTSRYTIYYKVTVSNNSKVPLTPGKENQLCFYLDDDNGHTLLAHSVQVDFLKPYQPGESRDGMIYFASINPKLLILPFVKLAIGKQCSMLLKQK